MSLRQVLVVRRDLEMSAGKVAAQCAHAAQQFLLHTGGVNYHLGQGPHAHGIIKWEMSGETIIVLGCRDLDELNTIAQVARNSGLLIFVQRDLGRTEVDPGTDTCLAIGPADRSLIDPITRHLRLY